MLREPDRVIGRVHEWMFQDRELIIAPWEEIVPVSGRAAAREEARRLVRLGQAGERGRTDGRTRPSVGRCVETGAGVGGLRWNRAGWGWMTTRSARWPGPIPTSR